MAASLFATTTMSAGRQILGPVGPEGATLQAGPPLAAAGTSAVGQPTAGVSCKATEQIATHIHAHLSVYVDGRPRSVPLGIGFVGQTEIAHTSQ